MTTWFHFLILALGLACGSDLSPAPEWSNSNHWKTWHACADAECREIFVRKVFRQDPPLAAHWLDIIVEPEERLALIQSLVTENPAKTSVLCPVIEDTSARKACKRNTGRPHLYAPPPRNQKNIPMRTAEGPERTTLIIPPNSANRLSMTADLGSCTADSKARSCLMTAAQNAAKQGDGNKAAQHCLAINGNNIWRGDCYFQAAETLALVDPIGSYPNIANLCRASGEWAGRCVDKVNSRMVKLAPPSNATAEGWASSLEAAEAIRLAWSAEGPVIRDRILSGFWSNSLVRSYAQTTKLNGNPLDHLPAEAEPHIRAACAWRLIQKSPPGVQTLIELQQKLDLALSSRVPPPHTVETRRLDLGQGARDFWEVDEPHDRNIPAIIYLGTARRALGSNPAEDMQICLLEAAARSGKDWLPLLHKAKANSSRLTAWTAVHLLESLAKPSYEPKQGF